MIFTKQVRPSRTPVRIVYASKYMKKQMLFTLSSKFSGFLNAFISIAVLFPKVKKHPSFSVKTFDTKQGTAG